MTTGGRRCRRKLADADGGNIAHTALVSPINDLWQFPLSTLIIRWVQSPNFRSRTPRNLTDIDRAHFSTAPLLFLPCRPFPAPPRDSRSSTAREEVARTPAIGYNKKRHTRGNLLETAARPGKRSPPVWGARGGARSPAVAGSRYHRRRFSIPALWLPSAVSGGDAQRGASRAGRQIC